MTLRSANPKKLRALREFHFLRMGLMLTLQHTKPDDLSRDGFVQDKFDEFVMTAHKIKGMEDAVDEKIQKRLKKK